MKCCEDESELSAASQKNAPGGTEHFKSALVVGV